MPNEFKPVYFAHAEYEVEKWSIKRLIRLLRLYGAHRCLWDIRDPDNRNRKLRKAALVDITAALGEGLTRAQVVQKINVLRATYRYEKRRIKQRIRKGIGAKTKLKWFALADAFLRNVPRPAKCRGNEEEADSDTDLEDAVVFTIDPETLLPLESDVEEESATEYAIDTNLQRRAIKKEQTSCCAFTPAYDVEDAKNDEINSLQNVRNVLIDDETPIVVNVTEEDKVAPWTAWTPDHSMHFVQLLKQHPVLWHEDVTAPKTQEETAIQNIALAMKLPSQRIRKRVHIFRSTCTKVQRNMAQNISYKPDFIWWPLAQSFMQPCTTDNSAALVAAHFVDANEPTPATPLNVYEPTENCYKTASFIKDNSEVLTNPIPSVETLLSDDFSTQPPTYSGTTETTNASDSGTRIIWNGLEDDLLEGKWSLKYSVKFLRLYGAHRCLWDLKHADYRSRVQRAAAIADIAAAMGYGLTADYVAKKIRIFRITYMQQRKRMLDAIKQGKQPDIQLRWFPLADSFLRPHIGLRCIKEYEKEMPQFDFQYVYANLNLIDPALLTDFHGKGTQNTIEIGAEAGQEDSMKEQLHDELEQITTEKPKLWK